MQMSETIRENIKLEAIDLKSIEQYVHPKSKKGSHEIMYQEILKWIKFAGMNQVKAVLTNELESDGDKIV
jgi:hypothetical protein